LPAAPRISAVIPAFQAERTIARALASVRAQSCIVDEILIVDDGSSDQTVAVAHEAAGDDSRVQVLCLGHNQGPSVARNRGLQRARNTLVAFLDADDVWHPQHLARVSETLAQHPNAAVASAHCRQSRRPNEPLDGSVRRYGAVDLLEFNPITQSSAIVRREKALAVGGYAEDRRFAEDMEFWSRLLGAADEAVVLQEETYERVEHQQQLSRHLPRMLEGAWAVRARLFDALRQHAPHRAPELRLRLQLALESDALSAWSARSRDAAEVLWQVVRTSPAALTPPPRLQRFGFWWWGWRAALYGYDRIRGRS
jgi:glycosyltransferase involved in cell wall biosynthesis